MTYELGGQSIGIFILAQNSWWIFKGLLQIITLGSDHNVTDDLNRYESVGWWLINEVTRNFTDWLLFVLSTESNNKNFVADHSLAFMKGCLLEGGLFCEMASQSQDEKRQTSLYSIHACRPWCSSLFHSLRGVFWPSYDAGVCRVVWMITRSSRGSCKM